MRPISSVSMIERFEKNVSLASDESNIRLDELVIVKLEAKISTHTDKCLYGGWDP
jgi:hypothetical protein